VYGRTRQPVAKELAKLLGRSVSGELLTISTPTLDRCLETWYRTHKAAWRPATARHYRHTIDMWLVPPFAPLASGEDQARPHPAMGARRHVEGRPADRDDRAHRAPVGASVGMAQRELTYNPAALVTVPEPTTTRPAPLSPDEAVRLLAQADGHRLHGLFVVATTLGLCLGEVTGLAWADVDLEAGTPRVRQQLQFERAGALVPLKTAHSRLKLTLPE
jgi:integrase